MSFSECKRQMSHRTIIMLLSLAAFIHNIVMNGAMNVIISSLQKEFYLSSKDTGIYISVYDIGSLISSIFVPILGARGSKPRWIAFGMCMLCIGCFVNVTPHFLRPRALTANETLFDFNDDVDENRLELCDELKINQTTNKTDINLNSLCPEKVAADDTSPFRFNNLKYVLYAANIINGLSSSSMTTLAFSYIEDVAPADLSTIYESIYYATGALGMGVGFMITSQFLHFHTDIDQAKTIPPWMKPEHPNWIGAWWLPFIVFGFVAVFLAFVICTFPRRISPKQSEKKRIYIQVVKNGSVAGAANQTTGQDDAHHETVQLNGNGHLHVHVHNNATTVNNEECYSLTQSADECEECDGYDSTGKSDATTDEPIQYKVNYKSNGKGSNDNEKLNIDRVTTTTLLSNKGIHSNGHGNGNLATHTGSTFLNTVKEAGSILSLNNRGFYTSDTLNNNNSHQAGVKTRTKQKLTHTLKSVVKLLQYPTFVFILIASAIEGLLQNSFLAFASLFLEYQYRLASGSASFSLGALSIPPLILGSLLSGYLIKRFDWKMKECLVFLSILLLFNIVTYGGFLVSCQEPNFIFNHDYITNKFDSKVNYINNQRNVHQTKYDCYAESSKATLCDCNENLYKPVCLKNSLDIVYESACIAGCTTYSKENSQYSSCSYAQCMSDRLFTGMNNVVNSTIVLDNGLCPMPDGCKYKLYSTYATIFCLMFITAMVYIPYMKVTIGCVESNPDMNAIALGIKQLAMTGIGTIPGPIIFGSVIDLTCKYWYTDCLDQQVCKVYNNRNFALSFGYLGIGFKFICWISVLLALTHRIRH